MAQRFVLNETSYFGRGSRQELANEIISNSYLERDFLIMFDFDEYISYINMFIDNNEDRLSMYDNDIMDYLRVFPTIVGDIARPNIRLYTNYREV